MSHIHVLGCHCTCGSLEDKHFGLIDALALVFVAVVSKWVLVSSPSEEMAAADEPARS